ncbi:MAG: hypothetical protein U1E22_01895 [Coriobacteriia bacterium]|nr:hypothetical protein [Coriobacteriia bacterium]
MRTSPNGFRSSRPSAEPAVVYMDDGGSGLLEACKARFAAPEYEVACDARHTVWVKRTVGARSFGLAPWLLRERSMNEVLESAEVKLGIPFGRSQ